jgi:RNA polymerase sigma-70 factor (ECF subfamily)
MLSEQFFTRMYRTHFEYVRRMLVKYGVPSRDSEDTAHDIFLAVWRELWRYDQKRPFKCWLFAFVLHFASDYRRGGRYDREELHGLLWWIHHESPSAEDMMLTQVDTQLAVQAVERLSPARREVVMLHADGWTMPEIVARLGIPLNTGYTRLRRARAQACRYVARRIAGGPLAS